MPPPNTIDVLNRMLAGHNRSLAVYLSDAVPYLTKKDERAYKVIRQISDENKAAADQLAQLVLELDGRVYLGEFPLAYTAFNDLGVDYLLKILLEHQQRLLGVIDDSVSQLSAAPVAKAVAQELRGVALSHLDSLKELLQPASAAAAHGTG